MKKIILRDLEIAGRHFERLDVLVHSDGSLALLPTLFSIFCFSRSISLVKRDVRNEFHSKKIYRQTEVVEQHLAFSSCVAYVARVFDFIKHFESLRQDNADINKNKFMNLYLNEVLASRVTNKKTLFLAKSALASYRLFLFNLSIGDIPNFTFDREVLAALNSSTIVHSASDYVSREERSIIKQACRNERDRLIIRCGYVLGLRTSENRALMLNEQRIKGRMRPGLLSLFEQLKHTDKAIFIYTINGIYTKYKKSRDIYIPRNLLEDLYSYYQSERKTFIDKHQIDSPNWLFIRYDPHGNGKQIAQRHATNIFKQALEDSCLKGSPLSYHKLRHTFATEYYASLVRKEDGKGCSEATALFHVAKRLGHAKPLTTGRYIRLMEDMKIKEGLS